MKTETRPHPNAEILRQHGETVMRLILQNGYPSPWPEGSKTKKVKATLPLRRG